MPKKKSQKARPNPEKAKMAQSKANLALKIRRVIGDFLGNMKEVQPLNGVITRGDRRHNWLRRRCPHVFSSTHNSAGSARLKHPTKTLRATRERISCLKQHRTSA